MYPARPGYVIGFHGCDAKLVYSLVMGETSLKESRNQFDWLGDGIYFWENNQQRALEYAHEIKKRNHIRIDNPSVVGAIIDMGFCLDLMDQEHIKVVKASYLSLMESYAMLNLTFPRNKNVGKSTDLLLRDLDCAVINNVHYERRASKDFPEYDSVRCAFIEGESLYDNAGFHEKNHVQICIRNPNCIKGYFIPGKPNKKWPIP